LQLVQDEQNSEAGFYSAERRRRTWRIVVAHLLIVVTFFIMSFIWGKFT